MIVWAVETLLAVTFLLLLVLAVRRPVARFAGAEWAYALWLLPLLRLVMPPLPQTGSEIPSVLPPATAFIPAVGQAVAPAASDAGSGFWLSAMLALWAAGAVFFVFWQSATYHAFKRRLGAERRSGQPPVYGGIKVVESDAVEGPAAVGLFRRHIVVPPDFESRYGPVERRLALEHELIHHRRGDVWWNMAALLILGLNWFNPLAWCAFRAFRADQELSCDALVAARATRAERYDYACALVKSATRPGMVAGCSLHHADQLKRRLKMMQLHKQSRARRMLGLAFVAVAAIGGLGATATVAAKDVAAKVQAVTSDQVAAALEAVSGPVAEAPALEAPALVATAAASAPAKLAASFRPEPKPLSDTHRDPSQGQEQAATALAAPQSYRGLREVRGDRPDCQSFARADAPASDPAFTVCRDGPKLSVKEAEELAEQRAKANEEAARRRLETMKMFERRAEARRDLDPDMSRRPSRPFMRDRVPTRAPEVSRRRMGLERGSEAIERELQALEERKRELEDELRRYTPPRA